MGCSHSARRPDKANNGKKRLAEEVKRYQKYNYAENPTSERPPQPPQINGALPNFDLPATHSSSSHSNPAAIPRRTGMA